MINRNFIQHSQHNMNQNFYLQWILINLYFLISVVKKEDVEEQKEPPPAVVGKYSEFQDGLSDARRNRVIETVTEEIGPYWRNLARYLGIYEYKIDEIQCQNITQAEKAMQIMEIYRTKADRQKWFFDLMDALEKAHRRDLSDAIKKIATMNI